MCEICSKLTIKTLKRRHLYPPENRSGVKKTSFWRIYCYFWTYFIPSSSVSIVEFEQINVSWVPTNTNSNLHWLLFSFELSHHVTLDHQYRNQDYITIINNNNKHKDSSKVLTKI